MNLHVNKSPAVAWTGFSFRSTVPTDFVLIAKSMSPHLKKIYVAHNAFSFLLAGIKHMENSWGKVFLPMLLGSVKAALQTASGVMRKQATWRSEEEHSEKKGTSSRP